MKKLLLAFLFVLGASNLANAQKNDASFTLQLLHFADIDGNEKTAISSVGNFSALLHAFKTDPKYAKSTLVVSSGDNIIPGPRFYAAEQKAITAITGSDRSGHIDVAWMNYFGVQASALGNHELDASVKEFLKALEPRAKGGAKFSGANFPYLSANIDFSKDSDAKKFIGKDGLMANELAGKLAHYTIVEVNGEKIGIIGATTPLLGTITSIGDMDIFPKCKKKEVDVKALAKKLQKRYGSIW